MKTKYAKAYKIMRTGEFWMSIVPTDVLEHQTCACFTVVFLSWRSYLHLGSDMSSLCDRERKADHLKKKRVKISISKFHQHWLRVIKQIKHCMCVFLCFKKKNSKQSRCISPPRNMFKLFCFKVKTCSAPFRKFRVFLKFI